MRTRSRLTTHARGVSAQTVTPVTAGTPRTPTQSTLYGKGVNLRSVLTNIRIHVHTHHTHIYKTHALYKGCCRAR
jgi:hypothetical protein